MPKFNIEYKVTGSVIIPEDVYKDSLESPEEWGDKDLEQQIEVVKEIEEDCGYEGIFDNIMYNSKVEIVSVTKIN